MNPSRILITGGYGCIGSETAKWLIRHTDADVILCSRKISAERTERVFHDVDRQRITAIEADVTDGPAMQRIMEQQQISAVAHLAALQTPDCNAHRDLGLQINLAGTQNLIEAIKASQRDLSRLVFASSIAVYGPRADYPAGQVPMLADPRPVNVYGIWKLAAEHLCRLFQADTGVPTVCLRPGVLFGPGRDAGLTASPTTAMKCLALGMPYEIPFASRQDYLYAPDVGAAFGNALVEPFSGYGIFTLPSQTLTTAEIVSLLRQATDSLEAIQSFDVTVGQAEVPFICDLDFRPFLEAFPNSPLTPMESALRRSVEVFIEQANRGWLTAKDVRP